MCVGCDDDDRLLYCTYYKILYISSPVKTTVGVYEYSLGQEI